MKKYLTIAFLFFTIIPAYCIESDKDPIEQAFALYATQNYGQASSILDNLEPDKKNENVFIVLANIAESNNNDILAIENLNKALDQNYSSYKAYYNLGCIFARKKAYNLAIKNFEYTIKYNAEFAPAYYNLAYCQMKLKNYKNAKKNLIKAIELEPGNKDFYYNLAICYKELNETKQAKKIIETINNLS